MAIDYAKQSGSLAAAVAQHSSAEGAALLKAMDEAAALIAAWVGHLRHSSNQGVNLVLLAGVQAALLEASGCLVVGMSRAALFSMRAQIDMALGWLFFKDHPVEWRHSQRNAGEGRLRAEVLKYLGTYYPRFRERLKLLNEHRTRREEEPYNILSAHVHSLTATTVPTLSSLAALVATNARCLECVQIQAEVSEYLSDILVACYAEGWADLPAAVKTQVQSRLSASQLKHLVRA